MTPYVFMMVCWTVFYYYLLHLNKDLSEEQNERRKKVFVVLSAIAMWVIMGLRHQGVGVDTDMYIQMFHMSDHYEWMDFFKIPKGVTFMDLLDEERGFWLCCKILRALHFSDQMFLMTYAFAVVYMVSSCIFKYCKNPFWGFYLMGTLGFFAMGMSGIRQTLAACIMLYSLDCILEKKFWKYLLFTLLATAFHQSAVFCIVFYVIRNIKINKVNGIIFAFISILSIAFRPLLTSILNHFIPQKYDELYGLGSYRYVVNPMVILIAILIPLFCLFFWEKHKSVTEHQKKTYSLCFVGSFVNIIITILSLSSMMIGRMSYYYIFFNVILLGNVITDIEDRNTRYIASICAVLLPGYMFFKSQSFGIAPYYFFWQIYGS